VRKQGHDARSRSAARDVLRYFDLAAPQRHDDEERHVFPRVLAQAFRALYAEHMPIEEGARVSRGPRRL